MIIELGNHAPLRGPKDRRPCVTTIHVPEFDTGANHPQGVPLGGYTHVIGQMTGAELRKELRTKGIHHIPDHEALLAVALAWRTQSRQRPRWVNVIPKEPDGQRRHTSTPDGTAADIQEVLQDYWNIYKEKPGNVEDLYHTRFGPPGQGGPLVPDLKGYLTNVGRVAWANNSGGGQVGANGTASATSATSLTDSSASWTTNEWAGFRVYAGSAWANVLSNTSDALTLDRWYAPATPGGSPASTPSSTVDFILADGGAVAAWFVGLTTTDITPGDSDTHLSGEYSVAGGGYNRQISTYTLTFGTTPVTYTLTPVFTGTDSDNYPSTFYAMGAFHGMVITGTSPFTPMRFETKMNTSATVVAAGNQIALTETVTGS